MRRPYFCFNNLPQILGKYTHRLLSTIPGNTALSFLNDVMMTSRDDTGEDMAILLDLFLSQMAK
jgi:hypothetical protein